MLKSLIVILICLIIGSKEITTSPDIKRKNPCSVSFEGIRVIPHLIDFKDTLLCDTLFETIAANGLPVNYFRNVRTGVCVEGKCRMINICLFWDPTGRYLGFELLHGEFLSKTDHVPFIDEDYDKLHSVLANSNSPLAHLTINDLVPPKKPGTVDAISSATIAGILESVVKGAVYTTYTLWHLVYGEAVREAEKLTIGKLTPALILEILHSSNSDDKIWMLNHYPSGLATDSAVLGTMLKMVDDPNVYLAERALNALTPAMMGLDTVQQRLVAVFRTTGFVQKRLILQKFYSLSHLNETAASSLSSDLSKLSGILFVQVLDLFRKHRIFSGQITGEVMKMLENENRFISGKAYQFLSDVPEKSREIQLRMKKYEKRR